MEYMKTNKSAGFTNRSKKKQHGISNIQIMVGVLISAILILGGIGLIRYIDKAKVNNDLSELTELKARTVAYGSSHGGSFVGFTQELAVGLDFFPANRVAGATGARTVANQWKGDIKVSPATLLVGNDSLLFTYSGVPSSACKELVFQAATVATWIQVNNSVAKPLSGPVDEATTVSACDLAPDNAVIGYAMTK
jgi:hypothetical protein